MLDYILLNKKKAWGLVIFFLAIFIVLTIANRTPFEFGLQKIWTNIVVSLALSFLDTWCFYSAPSLTIPGLLLFLIVRPLNCSLIKDLKLS